MTGNIVFDVIAAAVIFWLLRVEWRIAHWFPMPELLIVKAPWHRVAAIAARFRRRRDRPQVL